MDWFESVAKARLKIFDEQETVLNWGAAFFGKRVFFDPFKKSSLFLGTRELEDQEMVAIATIAGPSSDLFIDDLFQKTEILNGSWKITRLDLQLTMDSELCLNPDLEVFTDETLNYYQEFFKSQRKLEKDKERPVNITERPDAFVVVGIGSSKSGSNRISVYTCLLEKARADGDPAVRLEIRLGSTRSFIKKLKEQGLEFAKFELFKNRLSSLVETPLLEKHRTFIKKQEIQPSPTSKEEWIAVLPESNLETSFNWFEKTCLPAIKKLLNSDVADQVRKSLKDLLESEDVYEKVQPKKSKTRSPKTAEISVITKESFLRPEFENLGDDLFSDNFEVG